MWLVVLSLGSGVVGDVGCDIGCGCWYWMWLVVPGVVGGVGCGWWCRVWCRVCFVVSGVVEGVGRGGVGYGWKGDWCPTASDLPTTTPPRVLLKGIKKGIFACFGKV